MKLLWDVPKIWYFRINQVTTIISGVLLFAYVIYTITDSTLGDVLFVDISLWAVITAAINLAYGLTGYRFLAPAKPRLAGLISFGLFTILSALLILGSGGYGSQYLVIWLMVAILGGLFGEYMLFGLIVLTNVYFLLIQLNIVGSTRDVEQSLLYLLATNIPFVVSFLIWHNLSATNDGIDLQNDLVIEKSRSKIIIDSIADGVVVLDSNSQIKLFNPAATAITGWPEEEALGLDYRSVFELSDEAGKPITDLNDPFHLVLQNGQSINTNSLQLKIRSEKKISLSIAVSPVHGAKETVTAVVGIFRDISKERSEERQRAEFISTASHEMRTPVAAIEGYLALALNDRVSKIDSKAREFLEKAHSSTQHLGKLFQDLLTAAKSEDGRLASHPKVTSVAGFLDELVDTLRFSAEKKGLLVDYKVGNNSISSSAPQVVEPLLYVHVDPNRIREVITNLFDNAVKYTEEGKVTVGYTSAGDTVSIYVADTGPGIPKADQGHLFQKFYRVDNTATRQVGGTGLGLFISRKIVELYSGQISVESEEGKGSTFYISLPLISKDKAEELMKQEAAQETPLSGVAASGGF